MSENKSTAKVDPRTKILIEIGQRFGRLVVEEGPVRVKAPSAKNPGRTVEGFVFRCDCGKLCTYNKYSVLRAYTRSCGCLRRESERESGKKNAKHGLARHDGSRPPEYLIWVGMRNRCANPSHQAWKDYGGRGITVCGEWRNDFIQFILDMGRRPSPDHQIERVDNDGPYSKANCKWATRQEQAENRRSSVFVEHNGKRMTLAAWARETGIPHSTLFSRLDRGWPIDVALTTPANEPKRPS